jgi:hypothetical protein
MLNFVDTTERGDKGVKAGPKIGRRHGDSTGKPYYAYSF